MTEIIQNNLKNGVKHRVEYADKYALHLVKSIEVIAQTKALKNIIETNQVEKFATLFDYTMRSHNFYDMFFISKRAQILYSVKKESDLGKYLTAEPMKNGKFAQTYKRAMDSKKSMISNFYFYGPSKRYAAFIVSPVLDGETILGAIAVQIDINEIQSLADDYSGLGDSGEIILAQNQENRAVFINKLRNDNRKTFTRSVVLGSKNAIPVQEAVLQNFGSGVYYDYEDIEVIAAWGYINTFKIGMVIKVDTKEAYAEIVYLKRLSIFMGIIILMFILYVIYHIKHIVASLEETRNQYEFAVNGTEDGLWDWDIENNRVYFSLRLKSMLGYRDYEMDNSLESWSKLVHPEDIERVMKEINESHLNPEKEYRQTYRIKHKNGEWRWILDRGKTYFNKDGKAIRMAGFHTDVTQTVFQELKIKQLGNLLTNTINSIENLIFVKDKEFIYIECNSAFQSFLGLPREEIIGKSDYELFDRDLADFFRKKDEEMLLEGETRTNYEWVKYPDGHDVYLLTLKAPLYDENDEVSGLVGNSVDMTQSYFDKEEIKTKEEIMIAQSRHAAMGEMISMIAHQWRQPISVIAMDANNILADIELEMVNEDELLEASKNIINQTQELSKTIDDFREFFKPDKSTERVSVNDIINDAMNVIGKSLENNNIEVILHLDESLEVTTFSRELMQVIINILKNAKEALIDKKAPKEITLTVSKIVPNRISIQICDNGDGLDSTIIDKIFHPYFTTKGEKNGTGLGLYMSKTIIEKHLQGSIVASNIAQGACFEITIPENLQDSRG